MNEQHSAGSSKSCSECSQLLELLRDIKSVFAGDAAPNWVNRYETTMLRGHYLDRIDWALGLAGNKPTAHETRAYSPIAQGTPIGCKLCHKTDHTEMYCSENASGCPTHGMEHFFEGMCIKCGVVPAQGK